MVCTLDIYKGSGDYKVFVDKNGEKSNLWWTHTIDETNNIAKRLLKSDEFMQQNDFYNCITHENEKHYKILLKEDVF